jgi:hypothetical protein
MRMVHLRILEYSIDVDLQFDLLRDKHSVYQQLQACILDETKVQNITFSVCFETTVHILIAHDYSLSALTDS